MKKIALLIVLATFMGIGAKAQLLEDMAHDSGNNKPAFSIGPELAFPAHSVFNLGYGASAKIEVPVKGRFNVSLTGGYTVFNYKSAFANDFNTQRSANFIPLKAGILYALGPGVFFEGELGDVIETRTNLSDTKRNLFTFSLGPAFLAKLSPKQSVDIGVRYESWSAHTLQQTAIRVAYRIGW